MKIEIAATEDATRALSRLDRSEDIGFSPDGRRLAIAGFDANTILLLETEIRLDCQAQRVLISNPVEIRSSGLSKPHGLWFIDDDTLIVANREGGAPLLKVPRLGSGQAVLEVPAVDAIGSDLWLHSPGSVCAYETQQGVYDVLVCSNYAHYVTRHTIDLGNGSTATKSEMLIATGLEIPDGISVSADNRWIAVSNHIEHCVRVYENSPTLNPDSEPDGVLRGAGYPHGVRFTGDGNFILVADAGSPYVNIYRRSGDTWRGTHDPVGFARVMSDGVFLEAHTNPQEGGPKGIALDPGMRVLATTCEQEPLAFFELRAILAQPARRDPPVQRPTPGRTQRCTCGSGKRYKHCCGALGAIDDTRSSTALATAMNNALEAQRCGQLDRAEALYREALTIEPGIPDAMHMLGVVLYSRGAYSEAARLIRSAGTASQWQLPGILHNYALLIGAAYMDKDAARSARLRRDYDRWVETRPRDAAAEPLVSVIVMSQGRAAFVTAALDSVFAQTYRNLEVIVIDSGSHADSGAVIKNALRRCPFPARFVCRPNADAQAVLNEAANLARGAFINPLEADHLFDPERIATMVEQVARRGFRWGFAKSICVDDQNREVEPSDDPFAGMIAEATGNVGSSDTVGRAFLGRLNPAVASGNLFFAKSLMEEVGGLRNLTPDHSHDFCLRALWLAEPCYVATPLYRYRLQHHESAPEWLERQGREADHLVADYCEQAETREPRNVFAPARATSGFGYLAPALASGQLRISAEALTALDDALRQAREEAKPPETCATGQGLNLVSCFRDDLGRGEAARRLVQSCHTVGIPINIRNAGIGPGARRIDRSLDHLIGDRNSERHTLYYLNPPEFTGVWRSDSDRGELRGRHVIGYWHWDIDRFPAAWRAALDMVDEIWVASTFVEASVKRATAKPVIRIPTAVEVGSSREYRRADFGLPEHEFLFLLVFDFDSFFSRMNPRAAIDAFVRAFSDKDRSVGLVIKCINADRHPDMFVTLRQYAAGDSRIVILDRWLSRDAMFGLQSVCDACVSLHRSEGLGLGMAESMALGKPVIATAYSGNLDFMNTGNSCLVDYTLIPVKPGEYREYEPGSMWANADVNHAAAYMIRLVEDRDYRESIARRAAADMAVNYSHEAIGRAVASRLRQIGSETSAPGSTEAGSLAAGLSATPCAATVSVDSSAMAPAGGFG